MFSISFGEMFIIILVCLVVVGPQRLPKLARYLGHLFKKINVQASQLKREIKKEIDLEDLKQVKKETEEAVGDIEKTIVDTKNIVKENINADVNKQTN